ncbi:helix-turn-helix domain-containing protein [Halalkalicoccus jeotgali]|uniref:Bacterio-opsin activator HTH domain protein n=1 Tax=Halalkalicoccus jeotgali (strain DSM 18796 / CECT 7217 / JCM 14584 / KCTC 4019 / B3) TaxID=795797 RepID=D8J9T1_HALJB|nr:helix-turn-helix domain-containing protein [Halalkalicoccus jeotgali]ADJ16420.1 Bacterio-opsin activator HTH domain protein [Halalkalicoccus jeotgali B3]ELY37154.1 bacterio-opsin activator HTH domain-containing protein [Halalkalicoccus jeotgali B3]
MSVIAEIQIEGDFVLSELLAELPDVPIQLERVVPAGDRTIPLLWIHTDDPEPVEAHLRDHRLIDSIARLDTFEDRALYRIEWSEEPNSVFDELQSQRAALLDAVGVGESWTFELRFPDHEALSEFYAHCTEAGLPVAVERIYRPSDSDLTTRYGLTDAQYDTLLTALEAGYFDIPRGIVTQELGELLGVSDQAVVERIRRGLTNVLTHILITTDEE